MPPATDDDSIPVSQRVVEAVAEATGEDPTDVAPMYPAVDPDRLNGLFSGPRCGEAGTRGYVTFAMWSCRVVVWDDGEVEVEEEESVGSPRVDDPSARAGRAND